MSRGIIDGQEVITRQKATALAPNGSGQTVEMSTVDRVLLADGREVFQCAFPRVGCDAWYERVQSVVSHQTAHSLKTLAARQEAQRERRSAGVAIGRDRMRARRQTVIENGLAATLNAEAEKLEAQARMLRACAARANQLERAVPDVSPEELAKLREAADELEQVRKVIGGGKR